MHVRPHVGQDTSCTPCVRRFSARRMSHAAFASGTGSPVRLTRIVLPMPSASSAPMPIALLISPLPRQTRLGHADVQRIIAALRRQLIGGNRQAHIRRLHGQHNVLEADFLQHPRVIQRAFHQPLSARLPVLRQNILLESTRCSRRCESGCGAPLPPPPVPERALRRRCCRG